MRYWGLIQGNCATNLKPFPSWAYEVLFVNKKLGVLDADAQRRTVGSELKRGTRVQMWIHL
jgi:hypothetical protein